MSTTLRWMNQREVRERQCDEGGGEWATKHGEGGSEYVAENTGVKRTGSIQA